MKYFRTPNKPEIIKVLESFRATHGAYPTTNDIERLKKTHKDLLPSVRWIQKHGGITPFYNSLGISYIDGRTGLKRANAVTSALKRSVSMDTDFAARLVAKYGESNIHWQSPYNKGDSLHRSDFRVYLPNGDSYFVDLFFPQDIESLQGCVNIKANKLANIKLDRSVPIYFVCCNRDFISPHQVSSYLDSRKKPLPRNVTLLHITDAYTHLDL